MFADRLVPAIFIVSPVLPILLHVDVIVMVLVFIMAVVIMFIVGRPSVAAPLGGRGRIVVVAAATAAIAADRSVAGVPEASRVALTDFVPARGREACTA